MKNVMRKIMILLTLNTMGESKEPKNGTTTVKVKLKKTIIHLWNGHLTQETILFNQLMEVCSVFVTFKLLEPRICI